jgi:hypothetical protein
MWPYYAGAALLWVGSKIWVNATEGAENLSNASVKTAGAAVVGLGAYLIYKKVK